MQDTVPDQPTYEALRNPASVAVVTGVFYPHWNDADPKKHNAVEQVRGELALRTLRAARQKGYHVVVEDGGSSSAFMNALQAIGEVTVTKQQRRGPVAARRRTTMETGTKIPGVKAVVWTEAEKVGFIDDDCIAKAVEPILRDEADIVYPKRDEASWETYPAFQVEAEKKNLKLYNTILRTKEVLKPNQEDIDWYYGPVMYRNDPKIAALFQQEYEFNGTNHEIHRAVNPYQISSTLLFPGVRALKEGLRVASVTIPYRHPAEQTTIETHDEAMNKKRINQGRDMTLGLIHYLMMLDEVKQSRLTQKN